MESQREQPSSLHPASRDTLCLYYLITGMVGSVLPLLLLLVSCACSPWVPAVLLHPKGGPARGQARGPTRGQARGPARGQARGPARGQARGPTRGLKPEVQPKVKPEDHPEVKPEVQPEVKPEVQPEVKPEVQPEVKPKVQPEVLFILIFHVDLFIILIYIFF